MIGHTPAVLSDSELKSVLTLTERLSWNVARPIVGSLGLPTGKGREATTDKVVEALLELKKIDPNKFNTTIGTINDVLDGQIMFGEKALFSLTVDKLIIDDLKSKFLTKWNANKKPNSLSETLLDEAQVNSLVKNKPELVFHSSHNNISIVLFSSIREQVIREKIPTQALPQFNNYDEIIAKRKEKKQCYDVCIFSGDKIHILIDTAGNAIGESILFSKGNIVSELYLEYGSNFKANEKDFYPLIEPIFNQNSLPYSNLDYKVFDLSFLTNEGTTHKEKKNTANKDLRDDIFNKEGIKAVGNIGLYRIGIRVERNNPQLQLADNLELIIPGTLRRHLGGSSTSPVSYALLSKCICKDDFETLTKLIL
ncbi:hypothetical protein [Erwinia sp. S38]|uniref:hypothetical protein n=1 Tax=Erwinia sp. S38 TaxID=2769338 RepID=UPI00190D3F9C|nr:hypothetical protein [Erwinia sp. S38]MBK0000212.1 hypothetical protein [Erwinia sp. S38]